MNPPDVLLNIGPFIIRNAKLIVIGLDIILLAIFLYSLKELLKFRPHFLMNPGKPTRKLKTLEAQVVRERWESIRKRFLSGTSDGARIALIEADALVDYVLKESGIPGDHFADRLARFTADDLKTIDGLWKAHRLRNELTHEHARPLAPGEASQALSYYEAFLKEIGML